MKKPNILKVIVDRKKWYRGKGPLGSYLLTPNRTMCCIGFLAREQGCQPRDIRKVQLLCKAKRQSAVVADFNHEHMDTLDLAYEVNDDPNITDRERESKLIALGKKMNVRFTFTN